MLKNSNWLLTSNDGTNVTAVNGSRSWSGTLVAFEALKRLGDPEIVNGVPVFKSTAHQDFLSEYLGQQVNANIQQVAQLPSAAEFGVGVAQVGKNLYTSDGISWDVGALSNMVYGANGLLSWTEDNIDYTATYSGGNLATVTGGGVVKTFTYSGGQLSGVTVGAA
jgi:hypothetical protein